jgi:hypothetical protein
MAKNNFSEWSKEELIREIKKLRKRRKYSIVWENKPEQVIELCKGKLPVLVEDPSRNILTLKEKPTNILIEGDNYHALSVLNYTHKAITNFWKGKSQPKKSTPLFFNNKLQLDITNTSIPITVIMNKKHTTPLC